jgi:hypothetical protein
VSPPPPLPPKLKLKEFFHQLQEDCKLMVAELNMVCHGRLCHTQYKFENVKPVNLITPI